MATWPLASAAIQGNTFDFPAWGAHRVSVGAGYRYAVDAMLLSTQKQSRLIDAVERSSRWRAVYADDQAVVYVRAISN